MSPNLCASVDGESVSLAGAAVPVSDRIGSALDLFPPEDTRSEAHCVETVGSSSDDDRSPSSEGPRPGIDDADARKGLAHRWLVGWTIGAFIVLAIPAALGITLLAVATPFGFVWLVYTGLIQPVLRTEAAVIVLDPVPRLLMFAVWLSMMGAGSVALIRGWDALRGRSGFVGTDSVVWALATTVFSVLVAFGLSSWVVYWLLRLVG